MLTCRWRGMGGIVWAYLLFAYLCFFILGKNTFVIRKNKNNFKTIPLSSQCPTKKKKKKKDKRNENSIHIFLTLNGLRVLWPHPRSQVLSMFRSAWKPSLFASTIAAPCLRAAPQRVYRSKIIGFSKIKSLRIVWPLGPDVPNLI